MYNRYIPAEDGTYRRQVVSDSPCAPAREQPRRPKTVCCPQGAPCAPPPAPDPAPKRSLPAGSCPHPGGSPPPGKKTLCGMDPGDLLILLILLLLMSDGEGDRTSMLLTAALYFLLQ